MASQFRGGGRGFLDLVQTLFHNASMIDFEPSSAKHRVIGFPRNGRGDEANDSTTMVGYQPNPPSSAYRNGTQRLEACIMVR